MSERTTNPQMRTDEHKVKQRCTKKKRGKGRGKEGKGGKRKREMDQEKQGILLKQKKGRHRRRGARYTGTKKE